MLRGGTSVGCGMFSGGGISLGGGRLVLTWLMAGMG